MKKRMCWMGVCCVLMFAGGCASTKQIRPTDPAIATAASSARLAFDQGSMAQADLLYTRALNRARAMDDPYEVANNAYNLAACKMALNLDDEALVLLDEADAAAQRAGEQRSDIALLAAQAERSLGHMELARTRLSKLMKKDVAPEVRLQAEIVSAQMDCDEGNLEDATARLQHIRTDRVAQRAGVFLRAEMEGLTGRVEELNKHPEQAALAYEQQAMAYQQGGAYLEMAQALGRAAAAYQSAEKWSNAWDCAYRAARSLFALGNAKGALQQVESALAAAEHLTDETTQQATARLFKEIRDSVEKPAGK